MCGDNGVSHQFLACVFIYCFTSQFFLIHVPFLFNFQFPISQFPSCAVQWKFLLYVYLLGFPGILAHGQHTSRKDDITTKQKQKKGKDGKEKEKEKISKKDKDKDMPEKKEKEPRKRAPSEIEAGGSSGDRPGKRGRVPKK